MSLKRRLERLPQPARVALGGTPPVALPQQNTALDPARHTTLERLRQQMASILSRPVEPVQPARPGSNFADLGFSLRETPQGVYWRRRVAVSGAQCVGNLPVTGIAGADPRILSLLALDPGLERCRPERALFLDTEATGLGGGTGTFAFLVGLFYWQDNNAWLDQLLLEGPEQELAMLTELHELVSACDLLVTFNGKSFDWPLLQTRYVMVGKDAPSPKPHLDLLHVARRIHATRLRSCSLQSLESEVLGFVREDDVGGEEVALRYLHYLRSSDASGLHGVIEHNRWDVLSMAALMALYGEPSPGLVAGDLVGFARTLLRSNALSEASAAVGLALDAGASDANVGAAALRVRAEINQALGDHAAALSDLEQVHTLTEDSKVRLMLVKIYEHRLRAPERALALIERGVNEAPSALERRRARLQRKLERSLLQASKVKPRT